MKQMLHYNRNNRNDKAFANRLLAEHCMPVLLGIKPANTITVYKSKIINQTTFIEYIASIAISYDCNLWKLYEDGKMLLLILYQPDQLIDILNIYPNRQFLSTYGYDIAEDIVENALRCLEQRYLEYREQGAEFPHEMGIFLGYPLRDVEGFIENKGKNYLHQGYWKVYADVEKAKETFLQIHKAREIGKLSLARNHTLCYTTLKQMIPFLGERQGKE